MSFDSIYNELREKINLNPDYIKQLNFGLEDTYLTSLLVAASQNFKSDDPEVQAGYTRLKEDARERSLAAVIVMFVIGFAQSAYNTNSSMDRLFQTICRTLGSAMNDPRRFSLDYSFASMIAINLNAMADATCGVIKDNIPMTDAQKASIDVIASMFFEMAGTDRATYDSVREETQKNIQEGYNNMLGPRPNPSMKAN